MRKGEHIEAIKKNRSIMSLLQKTSLLCGMEQKILLQKMQKTCQ